jgi:8-oxo-dGTP diphosphatase
MTGPMFEPHKVIKIVAAMAMHKDQARILLVRKRGTKAFMQPGGKREAGETDLQALSREIREELGCDIALPGAEYLGEFSAAAAHEHGYRVEAKLYRVSLIGEPKPAAEIEEAIWIWPDKPGDIELAPLTRLHVLALASEIASGKDTVSRFPHS